jgi:hypothetical protein
VCAAAGLDSTRNLRKSRLSSVAIFKEINTKRATTTALTAPSYFKSEGSGPVQKHTAVYLVSLRKRQRLVERILQHCPGMAMPAYALLSVQGVRAQVPPAKIIDISRSPS